MVIAVVAATTVNPASHLVTVAVVTVNGVNVCQTLIFFTTASITKYRRHFIRLQSVRPPPSFHHSQNKLNTLITAYTVQCTMYSRSVQMRCSCHPRDMQGFNDQDVQARGVQAQGVKVVLVVSKARVPPIKVSVFLNQDIPRDVSSSLGLCLWCLPSHDANLQWLQ